MENIVMSTDKQNTWSFSLSETKDGVEKNTRVRKVENGFIVCVSKSYKDSEGNWQYEEREFISETNPLDKATDEKKEPESSPIKSIEDFLSNSMGNGLMSI